MVLFLHMEISGPEVIRLSDMEVSGRGVVEGWMN